MKGGTLPPPASELPAAEAGFDASGFERSIQRPAPRPWIGWRLKLLVLLALLGIGAVFAMMRTLADSPHLPSSWQVTAAGQPTLLASPRAELAAMSGRTLVRIEAEGLPPLRADELLLRRTARWLVDGPVRGDWLAQQHALSALLAQGQVTLHFTDGSLLQLATPPRGHAGLPLLFWPLSALALLLYLIGMSVLLRRPGVPNALFALMTSCQAANLLLLAGEPWRGVGWPAGLALLDLQGRMALDVVTAVAGLCAYALHPRRMRHANGLMAGAAAVVLVWAWWSRDPVSPSLWGQTQAVLILMGLVQVVVIAHSIAGRPDPALALVRRMGVLALATLVLVTTGVAATHRLAGVTPAVAAIGAEVWYLFFASLLLLLPFVSRPRRVLREFALLAGIGTVAAALTLVFVAAFALGALGALLLAMAMAITVYVGARRWILMRMMGGASVLNTERTFEQLYRVVRDAQRQPERLPQLLAQLLQELFAPREALTVPRRIERARVVGAGRALYVPVPGPGATQDLDHVLVMRHASHGRRIFTHDDARLAERVVDQVCRALAHDRALEQGRTEERQRIAQDLHDDIGARLLTLMYKAGSPEVEDYIRHTLQDLKTLTRGLAASSHPLAHAAGEWKADAGQRLGAAGLRFDWRFEADREATLSVVQWSALTRILRELVSNAIAHADASGVQVALQLAGGELSLVVADDGHGREPQTWAHGLGLGGVRKRVRTLGGQVQWLAAPGGGIRCVVRLPLTGGEPTA